MPFGTDKTLHDHIPDGLLTRATTKRYPLIVEAALRNCQTSFDRWRGRAARRRWRLRF
jgi:hypothetical protein